MDIVSTVLQNERDYTREIVESIIDSEQGYLFTNDQDYLQKRTDIVPQSDTAAAPGQPGAPGQMNAQQRAPPPPPTTNKNPNSVYVKEIRARLDAYFSIVVRNVRDSIPKAIGYFLVKGCQEKLPFELNAQINSNEKLAACLGEAPALANERKSLAQSREVMKKSLKVHFVLLSNI